MADSLKVRIDGDDKGLEKVLSGIGDVAKKGLGVAVKGITAIGTAFGGATVAALNFAGELEQNLGGSEAVFGEYAEGIQAKAETAFKNMGLSQSNYLATANKMGALFKGAGFEMQEAADISAEAMQRAADIASIMGIDVSMAMESIAGAAKGNFTMMDNLGVAMNDTTLNAYALEIGLGKTTAQMTTQEKVALAMEMFLDRTAYAAGNYAKENETLAGSLGTAKAALQNFIAGAGSVDDVVESLTNAGEVIIKNLDELVPKLVSGSGDLVEALMGSLITMITDNAPEMIDAAIDVLLSFIEGIEDNADKLADAAVTIMESFVDGISRMIPAIVKAAGKVIKEFANELGNAVPILKPLTSVIGFLSDNLSSLAPVLLAAALAVKTYTSVSLTAKTAITAWSAATKVLTAMEKANAITLVASNGGLTLFQTLVGLVTRKITLQTAVTGLAAKAQVAWNAVMSANPIGLVIGAVAALAVGITALVVCMNQETEAERVHREAVEANRQAISDHAEAVRQRTEAMKESASAGVASISHTKNLADELLKLADADGNVADADKGRAEFILGELNEALGTEYKMVGNTIQQYEKLKDAIYEEIEAKKLKILTDAAEETYSAAITEQTAVLQNQINAYKAGGEQMKHYTELQQKLAAAQRELNEAEANGADPSRIQSLRMEYNSLNTETWNYLQTNKDLLNACWEADAAVRENTASITGYEEALAMAKSGNIQGATAALQEYTYAAQTNTLGMEKAAAGTYEAVAQCGSKVETALAKYQAALEECNQNGTDSAKALVSSSREELEKVIQEYISAGGKISDGFITSLDITGAANQIDINDILGDVTRLENDAIAAGGTITSGFSQAILDGVTTVQNSGTDMGNSGIEGLKAGTDSHSPSRKAYDVGVFVGEGLANGISAGESGVITAAIKVADAAITAAKTRLDINSPSRVMRDEVGKMLTRGFAVGIDEGKTEVQKVMDEMNEELLDSEEKYNAESERLKDSKSKADKEYLEKLETIAENERKVYDAMVKDLEKTKDKMLDAYDEILDAETDFADGLKDDIKLFDETKITIAGAGEHGEDLEFSKFSLSDISSQTDSLKNYSQRLEELKNKADIPQEFFAQFKEMSVEEGSSFLDALLGASDEELQKYISDWEEYRNTSDVLAEQMYADDYAAMVDQFEEEFGTLPEGFFDIGKESGENFSAEFIEKIKSKMAEAKQVIESSLADISLNIQVQADSRGGIVNNYSSTYNIQPSGTSTAEQLAATRDAETLNRMRGVE